MAAARLVSLLHDLSACHGVFFGVQRKVPSPFFGQSVKDPPLGGQAGSLGVGSEGGTHPLPSVVPPAPISRVVAVQSAGGQFSRRQRWSEPVPSPPALAPTSAPCLFVLILATKKKTKKTKKITTTTTTVKCVVHWFQMMYSGRLSMFADGPASQYLPVTYDVSRVSCPVAIVYGGRDHLGTWPPSLAPPPRRRWVRRKPDKYTLLAPFKAFILP